MDGEFLFNRRNLQWYREALTLADYATLVRPHRVRLANQNRPDGFLIWNTGSAVPIEITEVMQPGRIRGSEYRSTNRGWKFDPAENWHQRLDQLPSALSCGIQKKERLHYPPQTILLIYLNISGHGVRQAEMERAIRAILSNPSKFAAVDVIWQGKLFSSSATHESRASRLVEAPLA
jgi:hypothetical protein